MSQQEEMTKEEMLARINQLSAEIDANEQENNAMENEIEKLYARIDEMKKAESQPVVA